VSPARFGGDPRALCVVSADDPVARCASRNLTAPRLEGACLPRRTSAGHSGSRGPLLPRCRATPGTAGAGARPPNRDSLRGGPPRRVPGAGPRHLRVLVRGPPLAAPAL